MRDGKKYVGPYVVVLAKWNGSQSRLGLVASRKLGRANARNRVKRRIREIFRKHIGSDIFENNNNCWDIVVVIRKKATIANYEKISACLLNCMSKIKK